MFLSMRFNLPLKSFKFPQPDCKSNQIISCPDSKSLTEYLARRGYKRIDLKSKQSCALMVPYFLLLINL